MQFVRPNYDEKVWYYNTKSVEIYVIISRYDVSQNGTEIDYTTDHPEQSKTSVYWYVWVVDLFKINNLECGCSASLSKWGWDTFPRC